MKLNETKNKEDVLDWVSNKRKELDRETKLFIDDIHKKLNQIEIQARTRIATFRTGEGYDISHEDFKKVVEQTS